MELYRLSVGVVLALSDCALRYLMRFSPGFGYCDCDEDEMDVCNAATRGWQLKPGSREIVSLLMRLLFILTCVPGVYKH